MRRTPRRTPLKSSSSSINHNVPNNTPTLHPPAKLQASLPLPLLIFTPNMERTEEDKENATSMQLRSPFHSTPGRRPRSLTEMRVESAAPARAVSMCGTEGWLEVLVERDGTTDGWRRRYVRLQQGRLFCYVGTSRADLPTTPAKDSAAVVVELQSAACATDGLLITLQCAMSNTLYKLRASSLVEADLWAQDIQGAHSECQERDATPCGLEGSPAGAPTPERISRRRAFLALEEDNISGAVMQCGLSAPPASPIPFDTGNEPPVWASATHAVSANGSFSMLNPCAPLTVEERNVAKELQPAQGNPQQKTQRSKEQGRLDRLRKVLRGGTNKTPESTLVGSASQVDTVTLE